MHTDVLIVGAGHAGVHLAVALSKSPNPPAVTLIGDEAVLPYERPPLTKRLLYDEVDLDPVPLRSAEYWQKSPVTLRTGERVVSIDPLAKTVRTATGESIRYGSLIWAAGGRAAACGLPGEDLPGVHSIRDLADLTALRGDVRASLQPDVRGADVRGADVRGAWSAVVVGGGYLGLETASGLRRRGLAVTVVELAPRLLARVTGRSMSGFFTDLHRREGTDIRVGVGVDRILERGGRAAGVRLSDGTEVAADVVIVGVGMRPNVAAIIEAGARGDGSGVEVDAECRTSLSDVYAIGDCAKQVNRWTASGAAMRVESVHNASQHAAAAARAICGLPPVEPIAPRFWSTQYGQELKTVGLVSATDDEVLRGDPASGQFSVVYLRDGVMAAIDTMNLPRDFARAQALVAAGWRPDNAESLRDPSLDLPRLEPASVG